MCLWEQSQSRIISSPGDAKYFRNNLSARAEATLHMLSCGFSAYRALDGLATTAIDLSIYLGRCAPGSVHAPRRNARRLVSPVA